MWSIHRQKGAPLEITLRQSSTPHNYQEPEAITISSVASPEPQVVTIESDSNEPTFLYAFGTQHPIAPPSLNDLNLPPTPSMCWKLWPLFNKIKKTAPNHRSYLIRLRFQRLQ